MLAGGTDLYPAHVGRPLAQPLLDITAIAALRGIRREADGGWTIGATTTWTDVVRADLPPVFDALKAAAREVGGVQIQNAGTVAGNVCNASPAADGAPALMALDARVVLRSERGERELRGRALRARQPAHGARAPTSSSSRSACRRASARARSAFIKLGGRRYLTISMTMVALGVDVDAAGIVVAAAASRSAAAPAVARRLPALEARLVGARLDRRLAVARRRRPTSRRSCRSTTCARAPATAATRR